MVQEAVEERGDRCGIAEELAPVIHRAVGRQERGRPLVAAHDHLEEVLGGGVRELAHAEVVDDEQRDGGQVREEPLAGAIERGIRQVLEQRMGFTIDHTVALVDRRAANGLREMTFAGARRTQEEDVLALQDEAPGGEFVDEGAVHLFIEIEIKTLEGAIGVAEARLLEPSCNEPVLTAHELIADQG